MIQGVMVAGIVVDTSVIVAILLREPARQRLVDLTDGQEILAPASLYWEMGNALSAMLRRGRLSLRQAVAAVEGYHQIPVRLRDVDLTRTMAIAADLGIYAYDAYMIRCALDNDAPLLTLDRGLIEAAKEAGAQVMEVSD